MFGLNDNELPSNLANWLHDSMILDQLAMDQVALDQMG